MRRNVDGPSFSKGEIISTQSLCHGLNRSSAAVGSDLRSNHAVVVSNRDPRRAVVDLDTVRTRHLRRLWAQAILCEPHTPTSVSLIHRKDAAGHAFTDQQGVTVQVWCTTVHEEGVGNFHPRFGLTVGTDAPDIARALSQVPTGHPQCACTVE